MSKIDFFQIVRNAWHHYDSSRSIDSIEDISVMVSTNHVYRFICSDKTVIIAKLSYFGTFDNFVEDHTIINTLSNNLPPPFDHFLSRSLMKGAKLFVHRHIEPPTDVWVVFYRPIGVKEKLPARLSDRHIKAMAEELAGFHKACTSVRNTLPASSKSMKSDIQELLTYLKTPQGYYEHGVAKDIIKHQCELFLDFYAKTEFENIPVIPVFVDWNIGNFSVTSDLKLFSRWDYDWFRMSSRMVDFYFFSRIMSDIGDRTAFSYNIDVLLEPRFFKFIQHYHSVYPLTELEIDMLPEMYRFFLLNYVVKFGKYFFHESYAIKLKAEVFETHLPSIENFDVNPIKSILKL